MVKTKRYYLISEKLQMKYKKVNKLHFQSLRTNTNTFHIIQLLKYDLNFLL